MSAETMAIIGYSLFSVTPLLLLIGYASERALPTLCAFAAMAGGVALFFTATHLASGQVAA